VKAEGVPTYSISRLEQIAKLLLEERWPGLTIPIDIDYIVEQEPDTILDYLPGLRTVHGVAGAVISHPHEARFTILIDEGVADGNLSFYRFTVAEEFAHLKLHRKLLATVTSVEEVIQLHEWEGYHEIDRNAKWLASALLIPPGSVLEDAHRLYPGMVRRVGFTNPEAVKAYVVDRLSRKYLVSPQVMRIRLQRWPVDALKKIDTAMMEEWDFLE
jgi:hypothetical protein